MKKNKFSLFLLLSLAVFLPSCTNTPTNTATVPPADTNNSSPISSEEESNSSNTTQTEVTITSVLVNGPSSVYVGESITLTAGVNGDNQNRVTWSSLNTDIATVDDSGKVTGVKAGTATIRATSVLDTTKYGDFKVTVSERQETPTAVTVSLTGAGVNYDEVSNTYDVEVYTEFDVSYSLDVDNPVAPSSPVTYRLLTSQTGASYEQYVSLDASTGHGRVLLPLENEILTIQVAYPISTNNILRGNVNFRIHDSNREVLDKLVERLTAASSLEASDAVSASVTRRKEHTDSDIDKTISYNYFTDATYATIEDNSSSGGSSYPSYGTSSSLTAYSGIQNDKFYNFTYSSNHGNLNVNTVYSKENVKDVNRGYASLPYNYDAGGTSYGLVNNVISFLSNSSYLGVTTISSEAAKQNLTYSQDEDSIAMTSLFETTDFGGEVNKAKVSLAVSFDSTGRLEYYSLSSSSWTTSKTADSETAITSMNYSLNEEAVISYGTKTTDASYQSRVNIDDFLVSGALYLSNAFGSTDPNITDPNHYLQTSGPIPTEDYKGQQYSVYAFDYMKTFAFRLTASKGGLALDDVDIKVTPITSRIRDSETGEETVSDPAIPVVNVDSLIPEIYTASDAFTNTGDYVLGDSLVTLTTSKGISTSFIARVTNVGEPTAINVSGLSTTVNSIRVGQTTSPFNLNATPDASYQFTLNVTDATTGEPANDALTLRRPMDTVSGTSRYVLEANRAGTFNFTFGIEGYEIESDQYTITVLEPLTEEEITEGILSHSFDYMYSSSVSISFDNGTASLVQTNSGVEWTDTFGYHIDDGQLYFDGGVANSSLGDGEYIQLGQRVTSDTQPSGPYQNPSYQYLRTDLPVEINTSVDGFTLQMAQYGYNYINPVQFIIHYDNALLKYDFVDAYYYDSSTSQTYYVDAVFNEDNTGYFVFKNYSDKSEIGRATFNYTLEGQILTITNIEFTFENSFNWDETIKGVFNDYSTSSSINLTLTTDPSSTLSLNGRM